MMRDNIKLYQNFSYFFYRCPFCYKNNHFLKNCPNLHYMPNKDFLISKFNFSQPQLNKNKFSQRKNKRCHFKKYPPRIQRKEAVDEDLMIESYEEICIDSLKNSSNELKYEEEEKIDPMKIALDWEKLSNKFICLVRLNYIQ